MTLKFIDERSLLIFRLPTKCLEATTFSIRHRNRSVSVQTPEPDKSRRFSFNVNVCLLPLSQILSQIILCIVSWKQRSIN